MATEAIVRFEALLPARGQELLDRLAHEEVSPRRRWLGAELRRAYPAELVATALGQHEPRVRARAKFTRAMRMYFTRPGLEQASSELTAHHRARRYADARHVADLCAGLGGDLIALAHGRAALAVDVDPPHLSMAERIAFLSTAGEVRSPFARTLRVIEYAPWDEKWFAQRLRALGIGTVDRIHRRLKLQGDGRATVVMTRMQGRSWGLICVEIREA